MDLSRSHKELVCARTVLQYATDIKEDRNLKYDTYDSVASNNNYYIIRIDNVDGITRYVLFKMVENLDSRVFKLELTNPSSSLTA